MRLFVTVPVVCLCLVLALVAADWAAPQWVRNAGLDVWNLGDEEAALRAETDEQGRLVARGETDRRWFELTDHITAGACDGRLAPAEAVEAMTTALADSPDRLADTHATYQFVGLLPATATPREVAARMLRTKLEKLHRAAEGRGDAARAALIADRLARLDAAVGNPSGTAAESAE